MKSDKVISKPKASSLKLKEEEIIESEKKVLSGRLFELEMEDYLINRGLVEGFSYQGQVNIGKGLIKNSHILDHLLVANSTGRKILVSSKYQGTDGTAEEKIVFEIVKLGRAVKSDIAIKKAYLILGGEGWSSGLKDFAKGLLSEELACYKGLVEVVEVEKFLERKRIF